MTRRHQGNLPWISLPPSTILELHKVECDHCGAKVIGVKVFAQRTDAMRGGEQVMEVAVLCVRPSMCVGRGYSGGGGL